MPCCIATPIRRRGHCRRRRVPDIRALWRRRMNARDGGCTNLGKVSRSIVSPRESSLTRRPGSSRGDPFQNWTRVRPDSDISVSGAPSPLSAGIRPAVNESLARRARSAPWAAGSTGQTMSTRGSRLGPASRTAATAPSAAGTRSGPIRASVIHGVKGAASRVLADLPIPLHIRDHSLP